ncbi:MAG: YadA-like family protein, partial [Actinobacillus porcinus]|uniref:YadA-like family protein n=2 Tax=Actinobacillus porcinus TaxID=51048 RepID=UPI0023527814
MVKRNALGQAVVCSEKTRARGKVKSIVLAVTAASTMLTAVSAHAVVNEGYAIGDQSIAVGKESFATGKNSVAIGDKSVATGNNLTADEIAAKLAENEQRLQAIENQKGVVATKEQDFAIKQDVFMRVQAADAKIAEHRENIANHLNPALITATNNYNDYLPIYEAKKQEYTARIDSLTTMSGFDLTKATNTEGITQLATELKAQAEQGFETIINEPVSYYEDYVRNYIRAKGELEYNKKYVRNFDESRSNSQDDANPLIKKDYAIDDINLFETFFIPREVSNKILKPTRYIYINSENGARVQFNLHGLDNSVVSLTQAEYDQVINKLEQNIPAVYQWLEDAKVIGAQTDSELANAKQMIVKAVDRAKLLAEIKFYQGEYERLGGSSTAEGLQALRTKIQKTDEFNRISAELQEENLSKTVFTSFQAWKKENITDVENMNTKFVNDFKANLTKMLAAEQKNHDDLLGLKNKAQQAVDEINRQIAQLEPSRADRETAAQAEPAHQELLAQRAELERLINELTLNDLKNIGANAVAIGTARATGANATAIGFQSNATNINAIAVGTDSLASKVDSIAIGTAAKSTGDESIAIGKNTHVSGDKSIAIGVGHTVSGNHSTTIGDPNTISGDDVFVAGNNNNVASNNVMVMGNNVTVGTGFDGAVVLGANSTVTAANPTSSVKIKETTYNFAGTAPASVVSVGKAGEERQITNVAAGNLTKTSTDVINGSQLYAIIEAINAIPMINLDDIPDTNTQATVTAGQGITIAENDNANGTKNYTASAKLGEGLSFDENGAIRANGTTLRAGDNVEITGDASSGYTISSKTQIINGGKATIVHAGDNVRVTGDVDNGFTVNVDNMRTTVTGGQGAKVTSSDNTDGSKNYTVNVKVGEGLTYDDKGNLVNDMKLTAGENVQVSGDAKGGYTISATDTNTQATVSADKGITVTETNNANGTKNYAVSAKLGKGLKVDENGAIVATAQPINGGAGVSITTNAQDEAVVNVAGVTTTTDDGKSYTRSDLTKSVGVKGDGKNIRTSTAANGDVQVQLADEIQVKNIVIQNGPVINQQGIDAVGTRITHVQDGVAPTDAVNVRQLTQQGNMINQRIDNLADHVKKNKKRTDAGIASTAAMTNIPQVLLAGQSGIGVGIGHRDGQSAIAVGYSRASENAKHSVKFSVGMDTQSKATLGAGYMYNW